MTGIRTRRLFVAFAAALLTAAPAAACPFCGGQGKTLTGEVAEASLVLFGSLENAKLDPNSDTGQGSTDLRVESVVKDHDVRAGKKVITLPKYLPNNDKAARYLIFCGIFKGNIDPYRGIQVKANSGMVKYLQGALALKDKPAPERLRFAFDYLDDADLEVATDAYKEFANADYKEYRPMAKNLPAEKLAKWLQDPDTPAFRFGLYASLLGHCGTAKDAALLKTLLTDKKKQPTSGLDGLMAGYAMLNPKDGWAYTRSVLGDPKEEFMKRYAALRAARFFWSERPDLVDKKDIVAGVCLLLAQGDIADLAIEDLRKWNRWEVANDIVKLYGQKSHDVPIIRRAILRFALSCQDDVPVAKELVKKIRAEDAELVKDAEELLRLEASIKTKS
jgi:hypothetical protein